MGSNFAICQGVPVKNPSFLNLSCSTVPSSVYHYTRNNPVRPILITRRRRKKRYHLKLLRGTLYPHHPFYLYIYHSRFAPFETRKKERKKEELDRSIEIKKQEFRDQRRPLNGGAEEELAIAPVGAQAGELLGGDRILRPLPLLWQQEAPMSPTAHRTSKEAPGIRNPFTATTLSSRCRHDSAVNNQPFATWIPIPVLHRADRSLGGCKARNEWREDAGEIWVELGGAEDGVITLGGEQEGGERDRGAALRRDLGLRALPLRHRP